MTMTPEIDWIGTGRSVTDLGGLPPLTYVLIGVALLVPVAAAIVVRLARRDHARHGAAFRVLCRGLGLGWSERRLVRRVARAGGISTPGAVLLGRGCFEHAAGGYARRHDAADLDRLRHRVFGDG